MQRWFDGAARWVGGVATATRFLVRSFGPFDTNPVPAGWTHVTKVDPEDEKRLPLLYHRYLRHTDAVSVGGSADVTAENTAETFELLDVVPGLRAFHEPSAASHVDERTRAMSDFLAIPEVLNGDSEALIGTLGRGTEYVKEDLAPKLLREKLPGLVYRRWGGPLADFATWWMLAEAVFEGYLIQNPDSAAAREGNVTEDDVLSPTKARRRALAAEKHLSSEIIYVEYSGTFGGNEGIEVVSAVDEATQWSRVWYGGGLDSREDIRRVLDAGADTVVVGDVFHEIAEDERRCYERVRMELDGPTTYDGVRRVVREAVDTEDTAAYRYLSTVPSVDDPRERALTYLARAVHTMIWVDERLEQMERTGEIGEQAAGATVPERTNGSRLDDEVPDALEAVPVRTWAIARFGREGTPPEIPVRHVGPPPETDHESST